MAWKIPGMGKGSSPTTQPTQPERTLTPALSHPMGEGEPSAALWRILRFRQSTAPSRDRVADKTGEALPSWVRPERTLTPALSHPMGEGEPSPVLWRILRFDLPGEKAALNVSLVFLVFPRPPVFPRR